MSATGHEHTFVWDGQELLPCACGANMMVIEAVLNAAADDARRVVGEAHYAGCRLRHQSETVELWLCDAPSEVLQELGALHPGVYAIHNDPPHTLAELLGLMHSIDLSGLRSQGIEVNQIGPRNDGYLGVGVGSDIAAAQAWFEAEYGDGLFRVFAAEPIRTLGGWRGQGFRSRSIR
jgi:hypothetical protein